MGPCPPPPWAVKIVIKMATTCGGLYFMFLGPPIKVSGSATDYGCYLYVDYVGDDRVTRGLCQC